MTVVGIVIAILVLVSGIFLIIFSRPIVNTTFFEIWPDQGISSTIAKFINYINRKKGNRINHDIHEIDGANVFTQILRVFGGLAILFSFFLFYLVLFCD